MKWSYTDWIIVLSTVWLTICIGQGVNHVMGGLRELARQLDGTREKANTLEEKLDSIEEKLDEIEEKLDEVTP